jgi:DNA-binding MarR family transcriptional regulator
MRRADAWRPLREHGQWMRMSERLVFYALLERSDNADCSIPPRMTPSLQQLAEACCCATSTVKLALNHLERHGWVVRKHTNGGRGRKTAYQLDQGWICGCPKQADSRPLPVPKQADSRPQKQADSHTHNGRPDAVSDVGISEGKNWQGSDWRTNWLAGTEYENSDA